MKFNLRKATRASCIDSTPGLLQAFLDRSDALGSVGVFPRSFGPPSVLGGGIGQGSLAPDRLLCPLEFARPMFGKARRGVRSNPTQKLSIGLGAGTTAPDLLLELLQSFRLPSGPLLRSRLELATGPKGLHLRVRPEIRRVLPRFRIAGLAILRLLRGDIQTLLGLRGELLLT